MNPTGGFVKVTNKSIGEDGQTEYFPEDMTWNKIYSSIPYIKPEIKLTETQMENITESFCEWLKIYVNKEKLK